MEKIALSKMIAELRRELAEAQKLRKENDLEFRVEEIDLEVKIVATEKGEGKVGVNFWVIDAGGTGGYSSEAVQTLRLKLKPLGPDGGDLNIHGEEMSRPDRSKG
jgi:hypothetical protein